MKKLICLFTILAFLGVANSMAQGLHFGLKAGVLGNKANVSGMRNQFKEESLTGFQVGPMLQYQTGFHHLDRLLLRTGDPRTFQRSDLSGRAFQDGIGRIILCGGGKKRRQENNDD